MPWYRAGTVAITAGQTTVTGTGTNFSANARVGDALLGPDGNWYEVTNIASTTVLSILPAYKGATVTGGTYAITPVQGYTKTLADKFNDIANTWGSTLAGLGSVSTENVVPVTKGGTGGATQSTARNGLGLKSAAVADIVGTASQVGGVPTGAIIERGGNANGEYVRFADGTQHCWALRTDVLPIPSAYFGGFRSATVSWTYPIQFSSAPAVTAKAYDLSSFGAEVWVPNAAACSYFHIAAASQLSADRKAILIAVGRWYG
ncbi:phage tail protein [Pseudomonas sp. NY15372]|uniref:phage tail protein n=1 Tax=Pseudomonas sp. NY15372 TaxID=3400356 RepID=UPI003A86FBBA